MCLSLTYHYQSTGGFMDADGGGLHLSDDWNAPHMLYMNLIEENAVAEVTDAGQCSNTKEAIFYLRSYREKAAGPLSKDGTPSHKVVVINTMGPGRPCVSSRTWYLSTTFGSIVEGASTSLLLDLNSLHICTHVRRLLLFLSPLC